MFPPVRELRGDVVPFLAASSHGHQLGHEMLSSAAVP